MSSSESINLIDQGIDFLPIILSQRVIKFDNACCISTLDYKNLGGSVEFNKSKVRFLVNLSSDWPRSELLPFMEWKEIERLEAEIILTKREYNQIIKERYDT